MACGRLLFAIAAGFVFGGCALLGAAGSTTGASSSAGTVASAVGSDVISQPSTFDYASRSTKIAFISPAALLNQNPFLEANIIVREQCRFRTPDPLFFVPDEESNPNWVFAGRLDHNDNFQALEYRSLLTLGLTKGTTQINSWPVELVSLADMPQLFLARRLELTAKSKLPPDDAKEMVEDYMRQAQQLEQVVARLEKSYNPDTECLPKKSG